MNSNYGFWAFNNHPYVLPGEKIIFTFDGMPVAEAICHHVEEPGKSSCSTTGKFLNKWKVFWVPSQFKKYASKTANIMKKYEWFGKSVVKSPTTGLPLQVYHGTNADFKEFSEELLGKNTSAATTALGFFFTDKPEVASRFGKAVLPVYLKMEKPFDPSMVMATPKSRKVYTDQYGRSVRDSYQKPFTQYERGEDPFHQMKEAMWMFLTKNTKFENLPIESVKEMKAEHFTEARRRLMSLGFDGIIVRDTQMDGYGTYGREHTFYIVFSANQIKSSIGNSGEYNPAKADITASKTAYQEIEMNEGEDGNLLGGILENDAELKEWADQEEVDIPPARTRQRRAFMKLFKGKKIGVIDDVRVFNQGKAKTEGVPLLSLPALKTASFLPSDTPLPDGPADFFEPVENPHSVQQVRAADQNNGQPVTAALQTEPGCTTTNPAVPHIATPCRARNINSTPKKAGGGYIAYVLTEPSRAKVLEAFPPKHARVVCHHVTFRFGVPADTPLPNVAVVKVVGYASDESLEALVCSVDGETKRADGSTFHVTLSLGEGRKPVDSNKVVQAGWEPLEEIIDIDAPPQFVPNNPPPAPKKAKVVPVSVKTAAKREPTADEMEMAAEMGPDEARTWLDNIRSGEADQEEHEGAQSYQEFLAWAKANPEDAKAMFDEDLRELGEQAREYEEPAEDETEENPKGTPAAVDILKISSKPGIYYHGTYTKNLRSILTQGLIPHVKERNWGTDETSIGQPSRESYGGIYVTANLATAIGAPRTYEGDMVLVIMELQPNTLLADEDSIGVTTLAAPLGHVSTNTYHALLNYFALTLPNVPLVYKGQINEYRTDYTLRYVRYIASVMEERGKPMHPRLKLRLNGLVQKCFDAALARNAAHAAKSSNYKKAYDAVVSYDGTKVDWDAIPPVEQLVPSIEEGERKFREACDKVTRALSITTRPTAERTTALGIFDSARVETSIGYNGSNHIVAVLEIRKGNQYIIRAEGQPTKVPIIVHYQKGDIPADFLKKWKESQGYTIQWMEPSEAQPKATAVTAAATAVAQTPQFKEWFGVSKVVDKEGNPLVCYHGTDQKFDSFETRKGLRGDGGIFEVAVESPFKFFSPDINAAWQYADAKGGGRGGIMKVYLRMQNPLDLRQNKNLAVADRILGVLEDSELQGLRQEIADAEYSLKRVQEAPLRIRTQYLKYENGECVAASSSPKEGYVQHDVTNEEAEADKAEDVAEAEQEVANCRKKLEDALQTSEESFSVAIWAALDEPDAASKLKAAGYDGVIFFENNGAVSYAVPDATQIKSVNNSGAFNPEDAKITASAKKGSWQQFASDLLNQSFTADADFSLDSDQKIAKDFGYSKFNDREADINKLEWKSNTKDTARGKQVMISANEYSDDWRNPVIKEPSSDGKFSCVAEIRCTPLISHPDYLAVEAADVFTRRWVGTGVGQMLYDKAIEYAKKKGFECFCSDNKEHSMSAESINAWTKRLSARYNVTFDQQTGRYMINLQDGGKTASSPDVEYVWAQQDYMDDEDGTDRSELYGAAYPLASSNGVNILSDKEPSVYAVSQGKLVGCLFISDSTQNFSFDVVVAPEFRNKGIGDKLIQYAESEYQSLRGGYDDYDYKVDVINPTMRKLLEARGFQVTQEVSPTRWLMSKTAAASQKTAANIENGYDSWQDELVNNPKFQAWFKGSKVTDSHGRPLRVFHGTFSSFGTFDTTKGTSENAAFFTPDPDIANTFADPEEHGIDPEDCQANVMPVYLSLKNPKIVHAEDVMSNGVHSFDAMRAVVNEARRQGYDGLHILDVPDGNKRSDQFAAFRPNQIKSAIGNSGEFSKKHNITAAVPPTHTMYHVSRRRNRASIKKLGLEPRVQEFEDIERKPGIYMLETLAQARDWGYWFGSGELQIVDIWEITLPQGYQVEPETSIDFTDIYDAWVGYQAIPRTYLKLVESMQPDKHGDNPPPPKGTSLKVKR